MARHSACQACWPESARTAAILSGHHRPGASHGHLRGIWAADPELWRAEAACVTETSGVALPRRSAGAKPRYDVEESATTTVFSVLHLAGLWVDSEPIDQMKTRQR